MKAETVVKYWTFIEALKDGKVVEHRMPGSVFWCPIVDPSFKDPPECYRVAAELKELWAVYQGGVLQVIRETKEDAENWSSSETEYAIVKMREVREDTTV
jgi:hypothetical protein